MRTWVDRASDGEFESPLMPIEHSARPSSSTSVRVCTNAAAVVRSVSPLGRADRHQPARRRARPAVAWSTSARDLLGRAAGLADLAGRVHLDQHRPHPGPPGDLGRRSTAGRPLPHVDQVRDQAHLVRLQVTDEVHVRSEPFEHLPLADELLRVVLPDATASRLPPPLRSHRVRTPSSPRRSRPDASTPLDRLDPARTSASRSLTDAAFIARPSERGQVASAHLSGRGSRCPGDDGVAAVVGAGAVGEPARVAGRARPDRVEARRPWRAGPQATAAGTSRRPAGGGDRGDRGHCAPIAAAGHPGRHRTRVRPAPNS